LFITSKYLQIRLESFTNLKAWWLSLARQSSAWEQC